MKKRKTPWLYALVGALGLFCLSLCGGNSLKFAIFLALMGGSLGLLLPRIMAERQRKKIARMITMDMADYLTSVSLLMTAGLTLWEALRRSLEGNDLNRPLFHEIASAFESYDNGNTVDPVEAFEQMAADLSIPAISTFVCALVQNHKKGSQEIAGLFMDLSVQCRNERRMLAVKLSDEATTLLLLPATISLIVMMLVLIAPAILQLVQI
jgi:Flp pilus assembly protein TadB